MDKDKTKSAMSQGKRKPDIRTKLVFGDPKGRWNTTLISLKWPKRDRAIEFHFGKNVLTLVVGPTHQANWVSLTWGPDAAKDHKPKKLAREKGDGR